MLALLLAENYLLNHLINLFADQTVETINNFFSSFSSLASPPFSGCQMRAENENKYLLDSLI